MSMPVSSDTPPSILQDALDNSVPNVSPNISSNVSPGIAPNIPQATQQASPQVTPQDSQQAPLPVPPAEVDHTPPLIRSITTLMRLRGRTISFRTFTSTGAGDSPAACLAAARRIGIELHVMDIAELDDILPLTLPCIVLLQGHRSAVLLARTDETATVIFPEYGEEPQAVDLATLQETYSGYAAFAAIAAQRDKRSESARLFSEKRWFWDVLTQQFPIYKHVIVASVLLNLIGVAGSLFAMNVYDRVVPNNAFETLWVLASGITLAYGCDFILRNLRGYFVDVAGRNADVVLSSRLVDKMLTLRFDKKPESTGALVNNLREFENLRDFFSSSTLLAFVDVPFLLLFLGMTAFIAGPLVLVPLAVVPVMIAGGWFIQYLSRRTSEQGFRQNMHKNALLVEMAGGLETIKMTMAEQRMLHQWEQAVGSSALEASNARRFTTLATTLSSSPIQMVTVITIVWGVYRIAGGMMTMGGLIGCNILIGRAMAPLMQISTLLTRTQQSRMALHTLDQLMHTPSENDDIQPTDYGQLAPRLTLEDVSFTYPGSRQASLDRVSLSIEPGEHVGIIGRMGSGKSTLLRLLTGLYAPDQGAARFGGIDMRQLHTAELRSRIGMLPQEVVLFYGSARDNIALADPGVNDRLVLRAAEIAGVTEFLQRNPAGFNAQVGERGASLSGGQRQAIALARALLYDPDILLLDEPTGNMDPETEVALRARLREASRDRTLVLVTHRMSMLQLVRRIIVMDGGRVILDGPKEQVLRELSRVQQEGKS